VDNVRCFRQVWQGLLRSFHQAASGERDCLSELAFDVCPRELVGGAPNAQFPQGSAGRRLDMAFFADELTIPAGATHRVSRRKSDLRDRPRLHRQTPDQTRQLALRLATLNPTFNVLGRNSHA
jgi:hypothetical protein